MNTCQNCQKSFKVTAEDKALYDKIGVPLPTYCFDCRMQQLMMWRNERSLYKRKDAFGKELLSIYAPETDVVVYSQQDWWKDTWDATVYGQDYDFSKPFFAQFQELLKKVPQVSVFNQRATNSEYCNHTEDSKDCHLIFGSIWNEGVMFSRGAIHSRDCLDILQSTECELCYGITFCQKCYNLRFGQQCVNCTDSWFLLDCKNCTNCVGCVNLQSKSYCIFNEQLSKEAYEKTLAEFNFGSAENVRKFRQQFQKFVLKFPRRFAQLINTENVVGDHVSGVKDCYYCFSIADNTENCRYVVHGGYGLRDSVDSYGMGVGELMYKAVDTGIETSRTICMVVGRSLLNANYGFYCHSSHDIFGCVGVRHKQYCILNKQYTKEAYEELVPKIIEHMNTMPYVDAKGREYKYGDFFPAEISPFTYNETIAQEYFSLTREKAEKEGYRWKDLEKKAHTVTMPAGKLPDVISDSLLKETVGCDHKGMCQEQCTEAFRLTARELEFYRKHGLPLPRLCPNCRHYERMSDVNPMRLWHRQCMCDYKVYKNTARHAHHESGQCPNEFETTFAPEREEIVYCEQCYQAEVV